MVNSPAGGSAARACGDRAAAVRRSDGGSPRSQAETGLLSPSPDSLSGRAPGPGRIRGASAARAEPPSPESLPERAPGRVRLRGGSAARAEPPLARILIRTRPGARSVKRGVGGDSWLPELRTRTEIQFG